MKIFKALLAVVLTALTFTLSATDLPDGELMLKSKVVSEHTVVLQLFNLQQEATKVSIRDLNGDTTYFQESIRQHNGYIRKLNLEELPNGRYLIEVEQDDITKNQVVLIRDGKVRLSAVKS